MSETEVGLRIADKFYPFVSSYTLGEARVLKQLTGLTLNEFARRLEETDEDGTPRIASDPDHLVFLIWVAMHRENPKVTIQDVESLDIETTFDGIEGGDNDAEEPDAGPPDVASPDEANGESNEDGQKAGQSAGSASESGTSTADSSQALTPETSGLPG